MIATMGLDRPDGGASEFPFARRACEGIITIEALRGPGQGGFPGEGRQSRLPQEAKGQMTGDAQQPIVGADIPRFGEYYLLRRIASGGMGEIYHGLLCGVGGFRRNVALKRMLPQLSDDAGFVKMLLDEARLAARLNHPNIAQVFNCGFEQGSYYIVMEYVEGQSLRSLLRMAGKEKQRLSVAQSIHIAQGIFRALAAAHEHTNENDEPMSIVHRDVTPENVMVSYAGDIKLVDFGIAKAVGRLHKTETGTIRGKLAYMAPEQIAGGHIDHRTDQFAAGLVLYEMLAGRTAYSRETEGEMMKAVFQCELPNVAETLPLEVGMPPELAVVVARCLSKEMEDRYPSCRAVNEALLGLVTANELSNAVHGLSERMRTHYSSEIEGIRTSLSQLKAMPDRIEMQTGDALADADTEAISTPHSSALSVGNQSGPQMQQSDTMASRSRSAWRLGLNVVAVGALLAIAVAVGWLVHRQGAVEELATAAQTDAPPRSSGKKQVKADDSGDAASPDTEGSTDNDQANPAPGERQQAKSSGSRSNGSATARSARSGKKQAATPPPPSRLSGTLNVACLPWCEIYLDNVKLAQASPLRGYVLPAGKHVVRVVNTPSGRQKTKSFVLEEGGKRDLVFRLK